MNGSGAKQPTGIGRILRFGRLCIVCFWRVWLALLLLVLLIFLSRAMVTIAPVSSGTRARMWHIRDRIDAFAMEHRRLPLSLDELPTVTGQDNSLNDSWGREIGYEIENEVSVTLTSLGSDGLPGGTGECADIIKTHSFTRLLPNDPGR